jgi:enoyl-CoA hydratase/carnithine racemase
MVVPANQLLTKTEEVAHRIAENGPVAVRKIKEIALRASGGLP